VIEPLITRLVQEAPVLDGEVIAELTAALRADARPLAVSIARVVELVGQGAIDAGIALPALAMACATLCDGRLTEREHEAARFEIETLLPVPTKAPSLIAPDVPLSSLKRR
jgi:hypothetical protein